MYNICPYCWDYNDTVKSFKQELNLGSKLLFNISAPLLQLNKTYVKLKYNVTKTKFCRITLTDKLVYLLLFLRQY